jgi:hypothetical protein
VDGVSGCGWNCMVSVLGLDKVETTPLVKKKVPLEALGGVDEVLQAHRRSSKRALWWAGSPLQGLRCTVLVIPIHGLLHVW